MRPFTASYNFAVVPCAGLQFAWCRCNFALGLCAGVIRFELIVSVPFLGPVWTPGGEEQAFLNGSVFWGHGPPRTICHIRPYDGLIRA